MQIAGARREFGEGPLARVASFVYTLFVVEILFVLTIGPSLILLMLLDRDSSNLPLAALCAVPVGPAASAALYALHHRRSDLTDLRPAAAYWRGYRANAIGILRLWIPWLAWLTIVGVNLSHFAIAGIPGWWAGLLVLIGLVAALWCANALVISSLFTFRARDVARLAAYFLGHRPGVAVANACLLVVAAGVTLLWSEAALVPLAGVFALGLLGTARPMIAEIQERFTT